MTSLQKAQKDEHLDLTSRCAIESFVARVLPFRVAGRMMEDNTCNLGSGTKIWLQLMRKAEQHETMLTDRLMRILGPEHVLLCLLSPEVNWDQFPPNSILEDESDRYVPGFVGGPCDERRGE